ncbi:response regulator [Microbacterium sp. 22195]|uniref:response regulator n=1 Tax=Microbacterium sp. 22195 TaxID=3453891 RepID=UPI003F82634F
MIRILVADDQPLVRAGIVATVDAQADMEVVGEAADGIGAIESAGRLAPDVVLMDIRMPGIDGIEATLAVREHDPDRRVLILTTFDADQHVYAALRAGACGFLVKDAPVEELVAAVRAAARGDAVLSPAITARVVAQLLTAPDPTPPPLPSGEILTPREIELVRLVADGLSNLEIGERMHLSEPTIKTHMGHVLAKLGMRDRLQVAVWAHRSGIAR